MKILIFKTKKTNTTNMHSGYPRRGIILAVVKESPAKQLKHKIPFHQA